MPTKTSAVVMPSDIISICLAAFKRRSNLKTKVVDDYEFTVTLQNGKGDEYTVELESPDQIDDDEIGGGSRLSKKQKSVRMIKNHADILDVCLYALSRNEAARKAIRDLTTDGDNHDCEAIFDLKDDWYKILKVR